MNGFLHAKRRHENTDVHMLSPQTSLRSELMWPLHASTHARSRARCCLNSSGVCFAALPGMWPANCSLFARRPLVLSVFHQSGAKNIPFPPSLISSNGFGFRALPWFNLSAPLMTNFVIVVMYGWLSGIYQGYLPGFVSFKS